jgi:hypothetical protein
MEDALGTLDKLTHEEARRTSTHAIDEGEMEDWEEVPAVHDRVASVDDNVAAVVNGA